MRDQHFSIISLYLKKKEFTSRITNINQICDCLNEYQNSTNKFRIKKKLSPLNCLTIIMPLVETIDTGFLKVAQLESLYNIQTKINIIDNMKNSTGVTP